MLLIELYQWWNILLIELKVTTIERVSVFECLGLMSAKAEVWFILECTYRVLQIINDIRVKV